MDVAKLYLSNKYTTEEIKFNKLEKQVEESILNVKNEVNKISLLMKDYGFSKNEVETLILNKLKES